MFKLLPVLIIVLMVSPLIAQEEEQFRRRAAGGTPPLDWTDSFIGIYDCEDSGNLGDNTGTCGASSPVDCDLTVVGGSGAAQDTTNFVTGLASCNFVADTDFLDSSAYSGAAAPLNLDTDISMVIWGRCDDCTTDTGGIFAQGNDWLGGFEAPGGDRCRISAPGGAGNEDSPAACHVDDDWTHLAFTYEEGSSNPITLYSNGAANCLDGCLTMDSWDASVSSEETHLANTFSGNTDEYAVIDDILTAQEVCRICACGIDAPADGGCLCNGATYITDGRRTTSDPGCGSCTLPDCNAAAP